MSITREIDDIDRRRAIRELNTYGYTKIANYISNDVVSSLLSCINSVYDEKNISSKAIYNGVPERDKDDKIIYNLHNIKKDFLDLLVTPFVKSIAIEKLNDEHYRFLPNDLPNYILLYFNARSSGQKLDLHIDSHIPFVGDRTYMMQFMFLLEDSTPENGCTTVVPGSHISGKFTDRSLDNVYTVIGNAGDLIIWDSRLWHGTLQNITGKSRWAVVATLGMWWIKPSLDIPRGMNNLIYLECTDEQKQLLGFCSIPPIEPADRINTKCGYDFLKPNVMDYFEK